MGNELSTIQIIYSILAGCGLLLSVVAAGLTIRLALRMRTLRRQHPAAAGVVTPDQQERERLVKRRSRVGLFWLAGMLIIISLLFFSPSTGRLMAFWSGIILIFVGMFLQSQARSRLHHFDHDHAGIATAYHERYGIDSDYAQPLAALQKKMTRWEVALGIAFLGSIIFLILLGRSI